MQLNPNALSGWKQGVADRRPVLGVVGLGYVGLPLAVEMARSGYRTVGFETDPAVAMRTNGGVSHVADVSSEQVTVLVGKGMLEATVDMGRLAECDAISICVPTPLNKIKDPDLSYVLAATEAVCATLRPGQLIILESTTYPGTTEEVILPLLEESGLRVGEDFHLCYSPERVDPGNTTWHTRNTPKVLGGVTAACTSTGLALYQTIFDSIVPVESARAAELVKVYENTFRMINIALANELAQACDRLDVNVWNVIDAAATKPFGFMKFTPGPGLGGHCIPLDPHYLSWKMRTLAYKTRMIELASEINAEMPAYVVQRVGDALNDARKPLRDSRVLLLGVAYKKDVDDLRESPALEIIRLLQAKGAQVSYHDPHCPVIRDDGHSRIEGLPLCSSFLTNELLADADAIVIVTDHGSVNYQRVREFGRLIIDTRGAMRGVTGPGKVIGLSGHEQNGRADTHGDGVDGLAPVARAAVVRDAPSAMAPRD